MDSLKVELFSYVDFFSELKFIKLEFQSKIDWNSSLTNLSSKKSLHN